MDLTQKILAIIIYVIVMIVIPAIILHKVIKKSEQ